MYRIACEIGFCYGHRLWGHNSKCRHLHGHNGKAVVTVASEELDQTGMVVDFAQIRCAVRSWIEQNLDHKMLLHRDDPAVAALTDLGEPVFVTDSPPTAEHIARLIYESARQQGYPVAEVQVWETDSAWAAYGPGRGDACGGH